MRLRPDSVCFINGTTAESFTNAEILTRAIPLARALQARGASGKRIMLVKRNTEALLAIYYGALFAGAAPFLLDPQSTVFELRHFLALVEPCLVFCDDHRVDDVAKAAQETGQARDGVVCDVTEGKFAAGHGDDRDSFLLSTAAPKSTALLLPTSGSTGLAKAAILTHEGVIAQMPSLWSYHSQFPRPTELTMFLSTAQWMTFTNLVTAGPVYDITMLSAPNKTPEDAMRMFEQFRPTWLLLVPGTAKILSVPVQPRQLTSLKTVLITGAPPSRDTLTALKEKLPASCHLYNSYGMTETQGFAAIPDSDTPFGSPGTIFNILEYKLVDDDNKDVTEAHQNGELYLKSDLCIIQGYLNNDEAYQECMTDDGWWKTGDVFYKDENEQLFFVQRNKFWFKYLNYHISPEELENLISSVPGVQECVACGTEDGAAAAVVVRNGHSVTREQIHQVVDETLIEYKRLRAGIAFVTSLPRTHSGKLHRADCTRLVNDLVTSGECY